MSNDSNKVFQIEELTLNKGIDCLKLDNTQCNQRQQNNANSTPVYSYTDDFFLNDNDLMYEEQVWHSQNYLE